MDSNSLLTLDMLEFIKVIFNYFMAYPALLKMFNREMEAESTIAKAE